MFFALRRNWGGCVGDSPYGATRTALWVWAGLRWARPNYRARSARPNYRARSARRDSQMSPMSTRAIIAMRTRCERLGACNFSMTRARCTSTVRGLMPSSRAMTLLELPRASRSKTSCSRAVKRSSRRPMSRRRASRLSDLFPQCESLRDAVENGAVRERLFDEVDGTGLDRFDRHGDVAVAGDDDDRELRRGIGQSPLQLQPIHLRHAHVDQGASGQRPGQSIQKGPARFVGVDVVAGGFQQRTQGIADRIVIVDDGDSGCPFSHRPRLRPAARNGRRPRPPAGFRPRAAHRGRR